MTVADDVKLYVEERFTLERTRNNAEYAIKLVERIVFAILTLFGLAVIAKLVKLVGLDAHL